VTCGGGSGGAGGSQTSNGGSEVAGGGGAGGGYTGEGAWACMGVAEPCESLYVQWIHVRSILELPQGSPLDT
jgi:hypothetical protein